MLSVKKSTKYFSVLILWLLITGCNSTPTPSPTATPIPGYVGGEEAEAYSSFIQYYDKEIVECYDRPSVYGEPDYAHYVDHKYPGKAVYVGAGIWRFHIQIKEQELVQYDPPAPTYSEKMIEVQSLADRTWANICNPYDPKRDTGRDYDPLDSP